MGLDSSVGIAAGYGLEVPGIGSLWGARISTPVQTGPGLTQLSVQWVPGLFAGLKPPRRGIEHQPSSSAEVKESVQLYRCFPSEPSWPVLG